MTSRRQSTDSKETSLKRIETRPLRPFSRPPFELPEPVPDTPESIARVVMNTNPGGAVSGFSRNDARERKTSRGV